MGEELDEFGIPIKKQPVQQTEVDEFGIPVKKKEPAPASQETTTNASQTPATPSVKSGGNVEFKPIILGEDSRGIIKPDVLQDNRAKVELENDPYLKTIGAANKMKISREEVKKTATNLAEKADALNKTRNDKGSVTNSQVNEYIKLYGEWDKETDPAAKSELSKQLDALKNQPFEGTSIEVDLTPKKLDDNGNYVDVGQKNIKTIKTTYSGDDQKISNVETVGQAVESYIEKSKLEQEQYKAYEADKEFHQSAMANHMKNLDVNTPHGFIEGAVEAGKINDRYNEIGQLSKDGKDAEAVKALNDFNTDMETVKAISGDGDKHSEWGNTAYGIYNSLLRPIGTSAVIGTVGGAGGSLVGNPELGAYGADAYLVYDAGDQAYKQALISKYNELKQNGGTDEANYAEAKEYATKQALASGAVMATGLGGAKLIGGIANISRLSGKAFTQGLENFGKEETILNKIVQNKALAETLAPTTIKEIAKRAAMQDAPAFVVPEIIKDKVMGEDVTTEGVAHTAAFPIVMNVMMGMIHKGFGGGKTLFKNLPQENKDDILYSAATYAPSEVESMLTQGVDKSILTNAEKDQLLISVKNAREVIQKLPSDITPEVLRKVAPFVQIKTGLEKQLETVGEGAKPHVEARIEAVDRKIAEELGADLTQKEQKRLEDLKTKSAEPEKELTKTEQSEVDHYEERIKNGKLIDAQPLSSAESRKLNILEAKRDGNEKLSKEEKSDLEYLSSRREKMQVGRENNVQVAEEKPKEKAQDVTDFAKEKKRVEDIFAKDWDDKTEEQKDQYHADDQAVDKRADEIFDKYATNAEKKKHEELEAKYKSKFENVKETFGVGKSRYERSSDANNYKRKVIDRIIDDHADLPKPEMVDEVLHTTSGGVEIKKSDLEELKKQHGKLATNIVANKLKVGYIAAGEILNKYDALKAEQKTEKVEPKAGNRIFNKPVEWVKDVIGEYKKKLGITTGEGEPIHKIDIEEAKRRADAFEEMKHDPNNPEVKAAYEAMAKETIDQANEIAKTGLKYELWDGEGEPYKNSEEMLADIRDNHHQYILSTEKDFGQNPITDVQREENPLLKDSGLKDVNGKPLLVNDVFRGIHDTIGHGERGNSFGAIGEENAWDVHARMYSPLARRAMTTETRGQNSWVNFGKHLRNEDGSIKKVPAKEKPFAEQKIGLMPEEFSNLNEASGTLSDLRGSVGNISYPDVVFGSSKTEKQAESAVKFYEKIIGKFNEIFGRDLKLHVERLGDGKFKIQVEYETGVRPKYFSYPTGKIGEHVVVDAIDNHTPMTSLRHELLHEMLVKDITAKFERINNMDNSAEAATIEDVQRNRAYNYSLEDVFYERVVEAIEREPDGKDTFNIDTYGTDVTNRLARELDGKKPTKESVIEALNPLLDGSNKWLTDNLNDIFGKIDYSKVEKIGDVAEEVGQKLKEKFDKSRTILPAELYEKVKDFTQEFNKAYEETAAEIKKEQPAEKPLTKKQKLLAEAKAIRDGIKNKGKKIKDAIKGTYYEPHMTTTKDGKSYVFFHVSGADARELSKGIDSRKFNSLRTDKTEKATQYGVASFYTKPTDGERVVGGNKYSVTVPKEKVYPMDTDPNGYRAVAERKIKEGTPFREEKIRQSVAEQAAKDGYEMAVGEWGYDRTGGEMETPALRADALKPLKPSEHTGEEGFKPATTKEIPHPEKEALIAQNNLADFMEAVSSHKSEKGTFDDAYTMAEQIRIYGGIKTGKGDEVRIPTKAEFQEITKDLPKKLAEQAKAIEEKMFAKGKEAVGEKEGSHVKEILDKMKPHREAAKGKKFTTVGEFAKSVLPAELYAKYKFLYDLADVLKIHVDANAELDPNHAASYGYGMVNVNSKTARVSESWGDFQHTYNHEIIHAILSPRKGGLTFDSHFKLHTELGKVFDVVKAKYNEASQEVKDVLDYIDDMAESNDVTNGEGGKTRDMEELVTYGMTHPEFAKFLDGIKVEGENKKPTTAWGKVKELIRKAASSFVSDKTALDQIGDILDEGFSNPQAAKEFRQFRQAVDIKRTQGNIAKTLAKYNGKIIPLSVSGEVKRAERKVVVKVANLAKEFVKTEGAEDPKKLLNYNSLKKFADSIGQHINIGVIEGYNEGVTGIRLPNRNEIWLPMGEVEEKLNKLFDKNPNPTAKELNKIVGGLITMPDFQLYRDMMKKAEVDFAPQKDWYVHASNLAKKWVGEENLTEFGAIWGITSAQSSVETNLQKTLWVMKNARKFNLNTTEGAEKFRQAVRLGNMADNAKVGKPLMTDAGVAKIVEFYRGKGYESDTNVKTFVYSKLTVDRGQSTFNPFTVMDTHMMRFFGAKHLKSSTTTDAQIQAGLNSPEMQRIGMYLTSRIAKEMGIRSDQAQSLMWFYAKHNYGEGLETEYAPDAKGSLFSNEALDEMKVISPEGSLESASNKPKTKVVVADFEKAVADGEFDKTKPYNSKINDSKFGYVSSAKSDIYSTSLYTDELAKIAKGRYEDGTPAVDKSKKLEVSEQRTGEVLGEKANLNEQGEAFGRAKGMAMSPEKAKEYHKSLVEAAKEYIKDGDPIEKFAYDMGETPDAVKKAWDEANGEREEVKTVGVSHEALSGNAEKMLESAPERGQVMSPEQLVERGRDLLRMGADIDELESNFKYDKKTSSDDIALARAHFEELTKRATEAYEQHGENSMEYADAKTEMIRWRDEVVKPMGTAAGEQFRALQGETELDTGNFVQLQTAAESNGGKPLTEQQTKEAKELSSKVATLNKEVERLKKKLTETIDKSVKEQAQEPKKSYTERAKAVANEFRRLKGKPLTFKGADGRDITVHKLSLWDDAIEIGAQIIEAGGRVADAVSAVIGKIKDEDWYKNLSSADQDALHTHIEGLLGEKPPLAERFVDKEDNVFDMEDVRDIWNYAKKEYLDKGADYSDMLRGVSVDLGLTTAQVRHAISQPKGARVITDEMYRMQRNRNKAVSEAKRWVQTTNEPKISKFLSSIPSAFFQLKTFGHGTVGGVTHAGMQIFKPSEWKSYFPFFIKQFKYSFGGITEKGLANYEKAMEDLTNDPDFTMWQRAGLAVDPKKSYDDYQVFGGFFDKAADIGNRGFNALKSLRLDLAKTHYNRLSEAEKADPEVAKAIAQFVNHATGTSDVTPPKWAQSAFFAPKLEASRWARWFKEPAQAANAFANWGKATNAEKARAKMVSKGAAEMLTTYSAMLAANAGILAATGSKQQVNFTDPEKHDFLQFKVAGHDVNLTGGMLSLFHFVGSLLKIGLSSQKDLKRDGNDRYDAYTKAITKYGRGKLSPFASTAVDWATRRDYAMNVLPPFDDKPARFAKKLSWSDYLLQSQTPIPIAVAVKDMEDVMKQRGMSEKDIKTTLDGIFVGTVTGTIGAHVGVDYEEKK